MFTDIGSANTAHTIGAERHREYLREAEIDRMASLARQTGGPSLPKRVLTRLGTMLVAAGCRLQARGARMISGLDGGSQCTCGRIPTHRGAAT